LRENTKGLITAFAIVATAGIAMTDKQLTHYFVLITAGSYAATLGLRALGIDALSALKPKIE
jgi:hypothetical protein